MTFHAAIDKKVLLRLVAVNLIRKAGASELDWLDELVDLPADYRGT
jgi:hypothetical protein